jgi:hypothetical protein
MVAAMAHANERAQSIVTPGVTVDPPVDHLSKSGPATHTPPDEPAIQPAQAQPVDRTIIMPQAAAQQVRIQRRSDDFLVSQAVMWIGELRGLAEEGKVPRDVAAEVLQVTAELTYALAGILKK